MEKIASIWFSVKSIHHVLQNSQILNFQSSRLWTNRKAFGKVVKIQSIQILFIGVACRVGKKVIIPMAELNSLQPLFIFRLRQIYTSAPLNTKIIQQPVQQLKDKLTWSLHLPLSLLFEQSIKLHHLLLQIDINTGIGFD